MDRKRIFGAKLKTIREAARLTQQDLAEKIDRSVEAVSNLERGASEPSLETLGRLAKALNTPIIELIEPYNTSRKIDPSRMSAETKAIELIRLLDTKALRIAIAQLAALAE
jgi:transcriptional regulator with XRE-family HTH domain